MKKNFTFLFTLLLAVAGVRAEVAADLVGKYFSAAGAATSLQTDTWYLLKNQGRSAYISEESNALKMKAVGNVPTYAEATANAGVLFKLASGENEGQYSIVSGNGNYLTFGQSSSAVSENPVNYIIGSIAEGVWYMQDPTTNVVADGNAAGGTFVGWGTSVPTSTTGNSAYQFLEVSLFDESVMTTLNKAAGLAYDLQVAYGLVADASKFSSNAPETNEGSFGALIDGEYTSFFHSAWSYNVEGSHNLQAEVSEPVESFFFYFKKRSQNNNNRPTDITILGSNDGEVFTEITTVNTGFPTDAADLEYTSAVITAQEAYKHFRFVVNKTNSGSVFFTFSEFYLLPADKAADLAVAQALVAAGPTAENFDELAAEFEAVCNNIQNEKIAKMHADAVANAESIVAAASHAKAPALGQYPTYTYNVFKAAVDEFKSEATQENLDAINAAIAEFEATKNLPMFTINSLKDYALGQSIYENENGGLNFKATDATDKSMLWAFDMTATEVGLTDKVVVRNVATGKLFWGASFISVIETEPAVEGDGAFMFKTEGTGAPVHAQASGSAIVRWSSADANTVGGASTWTFAYVGDTYSLLDLPEEPEVDPNDYTSYITNWNTSWSYSDDKLYRSSDETFDFYQTITLPAGQYKMTAQAAYRYAGSNDEPNSEEAEYNRIQDGGDTRLAMLYAQTATYKYEVGVQNRWDGASDVNYAPEGETVNTVNGMFVPNSTKAVVAWFGAGKYLNELVFNVQEECEVRIGIAKAEADEVGQYTNIGAWTLTRLGDAEADPEVEEPTPDPEPEEPGETTNVDCTDKVNKDGWICENGKANGVTIDGIAMKENFQDGQSNTSAATTGVVLWQTVEGLENGNYTVELWANARVAWQDSPATDGQEELTYLCANNVEISMKVFLNPGLNNNATYVLEDVEVTDGTMYIAMTKKAAGSNWHSIQIKSLTLHVSNNEALKLAKADLQAALESAAAVSPATEVLTAAIAAAQNVYDNSKSVDEVNATVAALKNATVLAINTNSVADATLIAPVATNFVVNGTFDNEIAPWQSTTGAQNQALATNQQGAFTGRFFENWNGSNYTGKLYQVIENIPNGLYELSICAFVETFNGAAQFVYANGDKKALTTGAPTAYTILTVVTNNTLEIGFEQTEAVNRWSGIDNASLKYFGEFEGGASMALISYEITKANAGALVGEKMAPTALEALNAAIAKEVDTTSDETLIAAEAEIAAAISAAKQSILLFANNKLAIDAMFALMESTNVYTVEAYEAYKAKAEDFLAQYEAGTLTTTVDNPASIHGWRAAVDYDDMLLSAFGIKDFETNLYINTWSTEGETDGSEFKVPFFEYWVGDGESLGATTKTATVTGLTPGMCYSVEAWVRVRAKNGVAAADATGITLSVGEGEATDVTEGEVIGTSQFSHAVFTATGVADAEGNLTININVLDGNNISWLAFKNLKYTEVEVVEPQYLPVVSAMAGDVAIAEGAATVESISIFEITFDRPVALAEDADWATLTDKWGDTSLKAEVLEENDCVVRFSLQWDVYTEAGDYYLYIPEGVVVDAEDANSINAAIEAVITIEGGSVEPATPLAVVNVTVGEDVMEGFTVVATTEDMIKVNFDGKFYFQGSPVIVDAEGKEAPMAFEYMNGLDMDGSNSYIFMGKTEGIYTITLPKTQFNEFEMMGWKAPAEDIVLTVQIVVEPEMLSVVGAKVGDVAIVEGAATVESISNFEITFDRPVALAEDADWATLTDKWGDTSLKAEVLEENDCVVRFSLQWDVYTEAGDYYLYIPEGVVVDAEDANSINAAIEAVITIEGGSVEPATPLAVVNVTVGEDVMEGFTVVATTEDMIKVNFDGKFYFQGSPVIVDAEGKEAPMAFEYMNGLDMDGSNSYIFMGKTEGIYTITLPKTQFNEFEMMGWKAPAEDIVLTVQITLPQGIDNINVDAETVIYDIHGRRVEKMEKGVYIVNGKKVIKK